MTKTPRHVMTHAFRGHRHSYRKHGDRKIEKFLISYKNMITGIENWISTHLILRSLITLILGFGSIRKVEVIQSKVAIAASVNSLGPSTSADTLSLWWKTFWTIKNSTKILMFGWRGFHKILPTDSGLYHRKISLHINYPLCEFGEDSNAYAVFLCPFAQDCGPF